jgi:serine/threonine-protein kinase
LFVLPDRTDALVGSMLGKDYRVLEPIGVGGMAIVYLVEHQTLLKRFAAKVLSSALASSLEARARFTQEAHAASQLDHENIVTISDFGVTVDQRPFFVMELLRGQTLDQRLATGRMTLEEVVAVCVPVARALAHAHAEGIVHLDVKPENIFLVQRSQGRLGVKVVDFGIAKTPLNPRLAKPEETAGSPLFMAPEVCRGDDDVDQRADVYSFGILLYLMMCGRLPFVDDSLHRILQMQLVQLPAPPREVNSELSPELAVIVERALAKERDDRYPSMEALLHDLEAALPAGADRLLIEAVSGTALQDTPFAEALGRRDSARSRTSRPPPISMRSISATAPAIAPAAAPSRMRLPIVLAAMVASIVLGLVIWRQIALAPTAAARGRDHDALASPSPVAVPHPQIVEAAPPRSAEPAEAPVGAPPTIPVDEAPQAPEVTPPAVAAAPSDDSPAAADDEPSPAPPAGAMTAAVAPMAAEAAQIGRPAAVAKRPLVRPKPLPYREVPRPPRRVASIVSVGSPAPAAAPITTPAGLQVADPGGAALATAPLEPGHGDHSGGGDHAAIAVAVLPPPPPPPAVAAPPPPPPANPGTLDATPSVLTLDVKGSLSPAIVRRSVERTLSAMRACYRTAARAAGATPALDLRTTFEIDENSRSSQVLAQILASGAGFGSLESCAAGVTSQIRTQEAPDVGTAQVTVVIRFRPS